MLDVLVIPVGSHGDVHPLVGVARALHARGHRVTVLTNDYFAPLVHRCGLAFESSGTAEEYKQLALDPTLWVGMNAWKTVFLKGAVPLIPRTFDAVERFVRMSRGIGNTPIVVAGSLALGARVAREVIDFPMVTVHLQPSIFRSVYDTPLLPGGRIILWMPKWGKRWAFAFGDRWMIDPYLAPPINEFRATKGLPPLRGIIDRYWHSPDRIVCLFPEWYAAHQPDWPPQTRLTEFPMFDERGLEPLPSKLETFLGAGDPPIAFTPGSAMWSGHAFFDACVDACRRLNRRGILLSRHAEHIPPDLPASVIHVEFAPFSELLPRCAAVVHHGGIGSTAQALAAGIPQLINAMTHDQPDNARRITKLGCGRSLSPRAFKGRRVARELAKLLDSEDVRRACRGVARQFTGADPLAETCELIEGLGNQRAPTAAAPVLA